MSKHSHLLPLLIIAALAVTSCVNKEYTLLGDIDTTIGSEMTLVGPIGHTKTKLFEVLPDSFHSFAFKYDGEDVYLSKQDSEYVGNEIIGRLKMLPKGTFDVEAKLNINPDDDKRGTFDETYEFVFDDINKDPNERLDSILLKNGNNIPLHVTSDCGGKMLEGSYAELSFERSEAVMNPDLYPDNKQRVSMKGAPVDVNLDMGNAMIKISGRKGFTIRVSGEVVADGPIPANAHVFVNVNMNGLTPRLTYGYIGPDHVLYEETERIKFSYTKDLEDDSYFLPFYNPQIFLRGRNTIGIPAGYQLDYVKLENTKTGEEVYADFNGSQSTSFTLNYPGINDIKGLTFNQLQSLDTKTLLKATDFELNREYGHTDRLFQIKGDYLEYHYKIKALNTDGKGVSYFFDDSDIDMIFDTKLVCKFAGNKDNADKNFYIDRFDTLKINFDDLRVGDTGGVTLNDGVMARIKIRFVNHLPVDANGEYWFYDENFKEIMPELKGQLTIPAAPSDANGLVTADSENTFAYIKLTYKQWTELNDKCKGIIFKYKVINKNLKDIWFKRNDWLEATADLWAKGYVTFNANNKENQK